MATASLTRNTTAMPKAMNTHTLPAMMPFYDNRKPKSYHACKDDFAATTIQAAMRVFLARREWEDLYVQHIKAEILRLKNEARQKAKTAKRRKRLYTNAVILQTLARGYIVRNRYRESARQSDRVLRDANGETPKTVGFSLMESVRKRMDVRQRIEMLKQQISDAKAAKNHSGTNSGTDSDTGRSDRTSDSDRTGDSDRTDEISIRKVDSLRAKQQKLKIKAKTLEAVTRPLQEKFEGLRAEHEKLRKKYRKTETQNQAQRDSNEEPAQLLKEKLQNIKESGKELAALLSSEGIEKASKERAKAQKKLDALVETANAYANLGTNERENSAFADEVSRIGQEAKRKAKLLSNLWSKHSSSSSRNVANLNSNTSVHVDSDVEDRLSFGATGTTIKVVSKAETMSSGRIDLLSPGLAHRKRGHGRVLTNLLRARSSRSLLDEQDRSISPSTPRANASFDNSNVNSNTPIISNKQRLQRRRGSFDNNPEAPVTPKTKPMRRIKSEAGMDRRDLGMRRVLSERKMPTQFSPVRPTSARLGSLRKELRDECRGPASPKKSLKVKKRDLPVVGSNSSRSNDHIRNAKSLTPKKIKKKSVARSKSRSSDEPRTRSLSRHGPNAAFKKTKSPPDSPAQPQPRRRISLTTPSKKIKSPPDSPAQPQPRRRVSITTPTIEIRKNKRASLRKTASLSANSKGRRTWWPAGE